MNLHGPGANGEPDGQVRLGELTYLEQQSTRFPREFSRYSDFIVSKEKRTMPNGYNARAAEFHEMAAHAHRSAAAHHGREDHLTGHEHSRQAMEYANKAHEASQQAFAESQKAAGKNSKS